MLLNGSTTVLPIAQKAAEAYMAENPDVKISLSGGGSGNGIKALKVDGVEGSEQNTLNGSFPISRGLFMFTKGWPQGETMDFISFILSRKGQDLVKDAGSIPLF